LNQERFVGWLGIHRAKFFDWKQRYGLVNEHNAQIPRDHWLLPEEKRTIIAYHDAHPLDGYRRLTFRMLDEDVVACSPKTVWRVLKAAGRLDRHNPKPSKKGTGFVQPDGPHLHWHIDVSYINVGGSFFYLCSLLDGYSRFIVHWDLRAQMTELDIACILQAAREKFPSARPRIISDNGPQFVAKDFKVFIRLCGMTHVRTAPYCPQSSGKIARWHKRIKTEAIRIAHPGDQAEARRLIPRYVEEYNDRRLHSAIGNLAPRDKLEGRERQIWELRDQRLLAARMLRQQRRQRLRQAESSSPHEVQSSVA
jgi:transposase InsO family protein